MSTTPFSTLPNRYQKISDRAAVASASFTSVYMGIGSVRLSLIRKWLQDILTGLMDLHQKTDAHEPIIHGRIRLQYLLYHRSTGQVRIGGYYWLTTVRADNHYPQVQWAEDDSGCFLFTFTCSQHRLLCSGSVHRRSVDTGGGHLRIGHVDHSHALGLPPVRRAGRQLLHPVRNQTSAHSLFRSPTESPSERLAFPPIRR